MSGDATATTPSGPGAPDAPPRKMGRPKRVTPEQEAAAVEDYRAGVPGAEILRRHDMSWATL